MSLANLSVVSATPQEWAVWSFSNQDQHVNVSRALFMKMGTAIPRYPLDPIPPEPDARNGAPGGSWLYNHQQWHNLINSALGVGGVDLTAVDFSRIDQSQAWIWLHLKEHQAWALALGIE